MGSIEVEGVGALGVFWALNPESSPVSFPEVPPVVVLLTM